MAYLVRLVPPARLLLRRLQRGAGDGVVAKLQVAGGEGGKVGGVDLSETRRGGMECGRRERGGVG